MWAFTELLVEEISSWGIYETTRRKAEAVIKARLAAAEAGRPKSEFAPGSMEYQADQTAALSQVTVEDIAGGKRVQFKLHDKRAAAPARIAYPGARCG